MTQAKNRAKPMDRDVSDKVREGKDIVRTDTVHEEVPYVYKPVSLLDIPVDIQNHFDEQGYALRWVRWQLDGNIDTKRLTEVERQQWTPVEAGDIPKQDALRMKVEPIAGFGDILCNQDLALFKIEKRIQRGIKTYFNSKAKQSLDNVNTRLTQGSGESVLNESKSQVAKGQRATHFDE